MRAAERGMTLVEAMVVIVLAGVVTIGLLGFYLNSQATWMDGSSQAMAQRDGTLILEGIEQHAHEAASCSVDKPGGETKITFKDTFGDETASFLWKSNTDSLLYHSQGNGDPSPITASIIEDFQVSKLTESVISIDRLRIRSTEGARITTSSVFRLNNAP